MKLRKKIKSNLFFVLSLSMILSWISYDTVNGATTVIEYTYPSGTTQEMYCDSTGVSYTKQLDVKTLNGYSGGGGYYVGWTTERGNKEMYQSHSWSGASSQFSVNGIAQITVPMAVGGMKTGKSVKIHFITSNEEESFIDRGSYMQWTNPNDIHDEAYLTYSISGCDYYFALSNGNLYPDTSPQYFSGTIGITTIYRIPQNPAFDGGLTTINHQIHF